MDIGNVVKSIISFLFEDSLETLVKPLLDIIEMVSLSPETIARVPFIESLLNPMRGIAAAIFILILLWQVFKSFGSAFGIEAEDPQNIAAKALIAGVLMYYINDLCLYFVSVGGEMVQSILDSMELNKQSAFELLWGMVTDDPFSFKVILIIILIIQCFFLFYRMFERLVMCVFLIIASPLAAACMISKATSGFFQGFVKLFVGNIVIQLLQSMCFVALITSLANTESQGLSEIFYLMLPIAIVGIANKLEDIVRDMSMSVGIGRDMGGAFGKVQGVVYTVARFMPS